jgi:hypothetical protein
MLDFWLWLRAFNRTALVSSQIANQQWNTLRLLSLHVLQL